VEKKPAALGIAEARAIVSDSAALDANRAPRFRLVDAPRSASKPEERVWSSR